MNWLDVVLLLILLLSVTSAARKGFTREVIGIIAAIFGLVSGVWFYATAGAFLLPYVSSPHIANFIGFFIVFAGFHIAGLIVSYMIRRFMKTVGLSWVDRLLGASFGALRGLLLSLAIITALVAFAPAVEPGSVPSAVAGSVVAPYITEAASVLAAIAPKDLKDSFYRHYEELKTFWAQKKKTIVTPKAQDL